MAITKIGMVIMQKDHHNISLNYILQMISVEILSIYLVYVTWCYFIKKELR